MFACSIESVCRRFDEKPESGSASANAQQSAGQAQAGSMGTGGFLNPPPGESFDEGHLTPQTPAKEASILTPVGRELPSFAQCDLQ